MSWVKLRNLSTERCSFCPVTFHFCLLICYTFSLPPPTIHHVVQAGIDNSFIHKHRVLPQNSPHGEPRYRRQYIRIVSRLWPGQLKNRGLISSLLHSIQIGSGVQLNLCSVGTGVSFSGGREAEA